MKDLEEQLKWLRYLKKFKREGSGRGVNMLNRNDQMGEAVRTALRERNGRVSYSWKNPEDRKFREKLAYFSDIPELKIIVVMTTYKSEGA